MGRRDWGDDDDDDWGVDTSLRDAGLIAAEVFRVNGPPGTGKTTWLTRQCDLAAQKVGGSGVVVASLTRAAAAEVAGRKTPLPRQNIGTLHSHAYQALDKPSICETAAGLRAWNDYAPNSSMRISNKHAVDPENAQPEPAMIDTTGADMLHRMNILRMRMTPREVWPPMVKRFADKWEQFKKDKRLMDFTDLIEHGIDRVPKLPSNPDVVMLDEAQDMSKLDMTLALQWGMAAKTLIVVGDADQNLYQWRGSDPEAFTGLPATRIQTLSQSYRVPALVHEQAVAMIQRIPDREPVEYSPRRMDPNDPESDPVAGAVTVAQHRWRDPRLLVSELEDRAQEGRTCMVLASCGYMLNPLVSELRQRGVPFWNPYRSSHGGWNPLRGARRLMSFLRPQKSAWGDEQRMWTWRDVHAWVDVMQAKGILVRGAKTFVEAKLVEDRFRDSRGDDTCTIDEVIGLFSTDEAKNAIIDVDIEWWAQHLKHTTMKQQEYALTVTRRHGAHVLREEPKIIVGTIHSVKGGEADTVYVMPDLSGVAYWEGYRKACNERDAVHRQMYVAMTRAREHLVLCRPSGAEKVKWQ
jgi:DNA helicase-2/ATP-dependent DNA helicase PcrA